MAKIILEEAQESESQFVVLPEDALIRVRVEENQVETVPTGPSGPWDKLNFKFTILEVLSPQDAKYQGAVGDWIYGGVPFRFTDHPDNQLKQWVEAIYGLDLQPGFELDTEQLNGRECKAVIENYTNKKGYTAHKVGSLIPMGGMSSPAPQSPAVAQPSEPQPLASVASSPAGGIDEDVPF